MKNKRRFPLGPGVWVAAAFIGPGTVLMASTAGAKFGYSLLWAVAFSVIATIILQEMAARLGIVTSNGLSQALKSSINNTLVRVTTLALVLVAILIGNAAYQTGNLLGAANGVTVLRQTPSEADTSDATILGDVQAQARSSKSFDGSSESRFQIMLVMLIGAFALVVIWIGRFDFLQLVLTVLVALMGVLFVVSALLGSPDWLAIAAGFVPPIPDESLWKGEVWFVIGLIGTTVVPYNLFLHANAAAQRWNDSDAENDDDRIRESIVSSRWDTIISVSIGGVVTCAILITAAAAFHSADSASVHSFKNVKDVAVQLKPLGSWSPVLFAIGLFAAGLTSSITAPIAAGYAAAGCFGWPGKLSDWRLKMTATLVVAAGVIFAVKYQKSPIQAIILAQIANGILLPIIATFLLIMVNRVELMKQYRNRVASNVLGVMVILIVSLIAIKGLSSARTKLQDLYAPAPVNQQQDVQAVANTMSNFP